MGSDSVCVIMLTVKLENNGLWLRRSTEEQVQRFSVGGPGRSLDMV
jgi:hypothetical protein